MCIYIHICMYVREVMPRRLPHVLCSSWNVCMYACVYVSDVVPA